jgi:hypothetical protein
MSFPLSYLLTFAIPFVILKKGEYMLGYAIKTSNGIHHVILKVIDGRDIFIEVPERVSDNWLAY